MQIAPNTLTCRVERSGGPVLLSFFGGLELDQGAPPDIVEGPGFAIASLLDLAATKAQIVQKRAEIKDYLDIDALLRNGTDLPTILAAARTVYGDRFNPLITLKALAYFDDVPTLAKDVKARLATAVAAVDVTRLPCVPPRTHEPQGNEP